MKKWNLSRIMTKAWQIFRKYGVSFREALHRAWICAKAEPINHERIEGIKRAIGMEGREVHTWAGWKALGYEVEHGEKAAFQITLIDGSRGDGKTFKASFFTGLQTRKITA